MAKKSIIFIVYRVQIKVFVMISSVDEMIEKIKIDCSDFIRDISPSGKVMYRGMKNIPEELHQNMSCGKSVPDYDDAYWNTFFNDYLSKNKILKRESVSYGTSKKETAAGYGNCFYVFPVNGYKSAFSTKYKDLYCALENWLEYDAENDAYYESSRSKLRTQLSDARGDMHIIKIYCEISPKMRKFIKTNFMDRADFKNGDMAEAMKLGVEVWFTGAYHAIPVSLIEESNLMAKIFE